MRALQKVLYFVFELEGNVGFGIETSFFAV